MIEEIDLEDIRSGSYAFQLEITARSVSRGYRVGVIPIIFPNRRFGKSKLSYKDVIGFLLTAFRIRFKL